MTYPTSGILEDVSAEQRFAVLADYLCTNIFSGSYNPADLILDMKYQCIIGMGPAALPYIFKDMQDHPERAENWFWALYAITMHIPSSLESEEVDIPLIVDEWLEWARLHHYLNPSHQEQV